MMTTAGCLLVEQLLQFGPRGVEGREAELAGGRIVDAGDALVFAEIDGENGRVCVDAVVVIVFMLQAPRGGGGVCLRGNFQATTPPRLPHELSFRPQMDLPAFGASIFIGFDTAPLSPLLSQTRLLRSVCHGQRPAAGPRSPSPPSAGLWVGDQLITQRRRLASQRSLHLLADFLFVLLHALLDVFPAVLEHPIDQQASLWAVAVIAPLPPMRLLIRR